MIEQDTIRLLRECDAGIKMGISSIDDVLDKVKSKELMRFLTDAKEKHTHLKHEVQALLENYNDEGKDPPLIAESMSAMKTGFKLAVDATDKTVADLMTDGCDMGVKSLSKYLNQYAAADEQSKDIAKRLIDIEADLAKQLRDFL
ncbi:MAG: hypothetical protein IKM24_01475 [Clostridia bacterium]|nr:hypothetical protein [Clostridia bacterium]MBR6779673.1 hypothetical protein [Clostridia bacterium]